jgi:serine phosphatase RsbU (regulator of sigma subunit)
VATLHLLTGTRKGQHLPLGEGKTVLGRDTACDLVIDESLVGRTIAAGRKDVISRRHAVITFGEGKYYLEDGDGQGSPSRNHTFVNDQQVPFPGRILLRHGDRIRLCDFLCTFHEPLPPAPPGEPPEPTEDLEDSSSIEASISHDSSSDFLESQPADKLKIILQISNSLSTTLDLEALLQRIVEHLFDLFRQADRGFIILRDETTGHLVPRVIKARRAGEAPDARISKSIVRQCLQTLQALLVHDMVRQFPDSPSVVGLPARSVMCAPLWAQGGQALGVIQLDTHHASRKFTQEDLNLLLGIASQASIALSNARLHRAALLNQRRERDLEVARQVELALLPQRLPDVPGYGFFAHYQPALEVGGDYYDFIPLPRQRLAVLLGDVTGKGVGAALVMIKFSVEARACLLTELDLAAAVGRLNTVMCKAGLAEKFVTLAAVVLDPAAHTATLVNAGHPSPLLRRQATGAVEEAAPVPVAGQPVGVTDGHAYGFCQVELQPGDNLVLFSDGIPDAVDAQGRRFRVAGIRAVLGGPGGTPQEIGDRLVRAVTEHAAGCSRQDDIALVCLGRAGS